MTTDVAVVGKETGQVGILRLTGPLRSSCNVEGERPKGCNKS